MDILFEFIFELILEGIAEGVISRKVSTVLIFLFGSIVFALFAAAHQSKNSLMCGIAIVIALLIVGSVVKKYRDYIIARKGC